MWPDMSAPKPGHWTRRDVLRVIPAAIALALIPRSLEAVVSPHKNVAVFSRFTDVARPAGLTETSFFFPIEREYTDVGIVP